MRVRSFFFFFISLFATGVFGQGLLDSPRGSLEGHVYKIENDVARRFAKGEVRVPNLEWFDNLFTTFPAQKGLTEQLPPGHYLTSKVQGTEVEWSYKQVPSFSVFIENDGEHLMIKVLDFGGEIISDAQAKVGTKFIPFDTQSETHKANSDLEAELLEVEVGGQTQFYQLTKSATGKREKSGDPAWRRFLWHPTYRWVVKPVIFTVRLPYDIVRSIVKRRLYGWPAWAVYRSNQVAKGVNRLFGNKHSVQYMLCSQPRYRLGDTVKVKAYIENQNGRPLRRTLQLLYTDKNGKTKSLADVKPVRPGCYVSKFVLTDELNLRLDQNIGLVLANQKRWGSRPVPNTPTSYQWNQRKRGKAKARTFFKYEDYELKQISFHLRAQHTKHWKGMPAVLFLEAKDMNQLTVPDARGKVYVLSKSVTEWRQDIDFLPDTLWKWEGNYDVSGETRLEIPFAQFASAAFNYEVVAECLTSDNERKEQKLKIEYVHTRDEIKVNKSGNQIQIAMLRSGDTIPTSAELFFIPHGNNAIAMHKWVELPTELKWPLNYNRLRILTSTAAKTWTPRNSSALNIRGQHLGDSIKIFAASNDKSLFAYHVFDEEEEVASGNANQFKYQAKAKYKHDYHLVIHRIVNGKAVTANQTFHWRKNDLQVDWKGPKTIYPGMTADMEVQVRTAKGKPVKKVDVTALAINSRFGGYTAPPIPSASKAAKPRKTKGLWQASQVTHKAGKMALDYDFWASKFDLPKRAWYQFLYPKERIYYSYHAIEEEKTEIAPFVVQNGQIQPVQIVYIDGFPVYFAWAVPTVPYSFPVKSGHHRIELRLPNQTVKIDDFYMKAGHKAILSIDADHHQYEDKRIYKRVSRWKKYKNSTNIGTAVRNRPWRWLDRIIPGKKHIVIEPKEQRIKIQQTTPKLTVGEQRIINSNTFAYRGTGRNRLGLIQVGNRLLKLDPTGEALSGPVGHNKMNVEVVDQFKHSLDFEPNFEFDFFPKLVKMRTLVPARMPQLFNYRPNQFIEDRPWDRDSLIAQWRRSLVRPLRKGHQYISRNNRFKGRLLLDFGCADCSQQSPSYIMFKSLDSKRQHIVAFRNNKAEFGAPIGDWNTFLIFEDNRFLMIDTVKVKPNGRNFLRLQKRATQVQDSFWIKHNFPVLSRENGKQDIKYQRGNSSEIFARTRPMSGRKTRVYGVVSDKESGEGLPYAVVVCKGFGVGTLTDEYGNYELSVPVETDTIEVVYLGYDRTIVIWDGRHNVNVELEDQELLLESVKIRGARQYRASKELAMATTSITTIDVSRVSSVRGVSRNAKRKKRSQSTLIPISGGVPAEYGDVNGPVNIVPAFPEELMDDLVGKSVVRKDFRDNAIWEPSLRSDKKGKAKFRVKFPEDITRWDAFAVAVDRRGRTGAVRSEIKAWKPIAGRLAMPRFFYEGDSVNVIGKVLNYTQDTVEMHRVFKQGDQVLSARTGSVGPIALDTFAIIPDAQKDSFKLSYLAEKSDGYGDGEAWGVRIFPKGIVQSDGQFLTLFDSGHVTIPAFDPNKGDIYVRATSSLGELLLVETKRLHNYEHLCNEQLASKLIGLLTEQSIFESMDRKWTGKKHVQRILFKLKRRLRESSYGWGWWPGMRNEHWISRHVLRALSWAKSFGYNVDIKFVNWAPYLLSRLDRKNPSGNLEILELVQKVDSGLDISSHINALDTMKYWSHTMNLRKMELRQKAGLEIDLDSLDSLSSTDLYGRRSWSYSYPYRYRWSVWRGDVLSTLAAYRMFRRAGKSVADLSPVIAFILNKRNANGWRNTFETAQVLWTLVPDIGIEGITGNAKMNLKVDGINHELEMDSTYVFPSTSSMVVQKSDFGIDHFSAYQKWFDKAPKAIDSLFYVHTYFTDKESGKEISKLEAGRPVTMHVEVNVKKAGEYLMLEVPIPSSCSYAEKPTGYYNSGYGCYREYFREKTAFYFRNLSRRRYNFSIELLPRYTGSFTVNTARIESMYFPVLAGQNEIERVLVE